MEIGKVKATIARYAKDNNVEVQVAWDAFFFDNFLDILSHSKYKNLFVFKGGFYLQKIVGIETRNTMDIDLKMVSDEISSEGLARIFTEICEQSKEI